jgi:type IV pilus assembly protein PilO
MALDLNEKPLWVALVIGLVVGGVLVFAANTYIFKEIEKDIRRVEDSIDKLNREIEKGLAAKRDLPRIEEDIENLQEELDRLLRILPTRRETDDLIKRLKGLVERGNFRLTRFTPQRFEDREFYHEWPIRVELDGTYHELGKFFDRMSRFSRIINVNQLRVGPLSGKGDFTIHAAFTQRTYIYKEGSS